MQGARGWASAASHRSHRPMALDALARHSTDPMAIIIIAILVKHIVGRLALFSIFISEETSYV